MANFAIIPQAKGSDGYVELSTPSSTRKPQGRLFEKQILKMGTLHHPKAKGGKVQIDDAFVDKLIENFDKGACDIVQVTVVDEKNRHTEDPLRNIGEVIGLTKRDNKVYAVLDARNEAAADALGKTLIGASAAMYLDYTDTDTLQNVGPTLTHVAVTNRPYVLGLDSYKEVVELSANGSDDEDDVFVLTTSEKETPMEKAEFLALAKDTFGIDIEALQAIAEEHEVNVALSASIQSALAETGVLHLSNGEQATADDLITAVAETVKSNITLSSRVDTLEEKAKRDNATARVESLIRQGKIMPAVKDAQIELLLSNEELFESLLPEKAIVALSQNDEDEIGTVNLSNSQDLAVQSEVDRIVADAAKAGIVSVKS